MSHGSMSLCMRTTLMPPSAVCLPKFVNYCMLLDMRLWILFCSVNLWCLKKNMKKPMFIKFKKNLKTNMSKVECVYHMKFGLHTFLVACGVQSLVLTLWTSGQRLVAAQGVQSLVLSVPILN